MKIFQKHFEGITWRQSLADLSHEKHVEQALYYNVNGN